LRYLLLVLLSVLLVSATFAGTITGKVTGKASGDPLAGANVYLQGMPVGAATDEGGMYSFEVKDGSYILICDYVGYAKQTVSLDVSGAVTYDFAMVEFLFAKTINVVADRAKERETPVAFSNVTKERMQHTLGSQDIPLVLNTTPSVYATVAGGGAGDARMNIRGFDQRNVSIMINGMPVNDMENGWLYWSNWDGVADATSSIQVQRGLSAVNLATPSVGGTMNIVTDPAAHEAGLLFKQEYGTAGFQKTTFAGHSGLINDKFAVSGSIIRKTGRGIIDYTWTDAWAYYLGASYNVNDNNTLQLFALGAPQRHGQNLYAQNMAVYSTNYALGQGDYDREALTKFNMVGRNFNQNWAPVDPSYTDQQHWNEQTGDRYNPHAIMHRENFFHKPLVNLNWFSQLSDKLSLYTIAYWSGGHGGGTGELGDLVRQSFEGSFDNSTGKFYYFGSPWTFDWNASIAINRDSTTAWIDKRQYDKEKGQSLGILRNSRNNQNTYGALVKSFWKTTDNLQTSFGIDLRTAEIEHYREVRDLLGGTYFDPRAVEEDTSDFWSESEMQRKLGDKVAYNFTNTVDWLGFYAQGEYTAGKLTAFGMVGYSTIKYNYTNHFRAADTLANGGPDLSSGELSTETEWFNGCRLKGGASYRFTDNVNMYGNLGYISRVPIFDDVIDDVSGIVNEDVDNQEFISFELGLGYVSKDRTFGITVNGYHTSWYNRTFKDDEYDLEGEEVLVYLKGVDARHIGIEFEGFWQPSDFMRFNYAFAAGDWIYTKDVTGFTRVIGSDDDVHYTFYIKDLKVGDAPQTQFSLASSIFPADGLTATLIYQNYSDHYANFDAFTRNVEDDRTQSWLIPSANIFDLHLTYDLPGSWNGVNLTFFAHFFNVFNTVWIQDATDNSQYNAWDYDHDADDAEVFFGLPAFSNFGLTLTY